MAGLNKSWARRGIALLLLLVMACGGVPASAYAEEPEVVSNEQTSPIEEVQPQSADAPKTPQEDLPALTAEDDPQDWVMEITAYANDQVFETKATVPPDSSRSVYEIWGMLGFGNGEVIEGRPACDPSEPMYFTNLDQDASYSVVLLDDNQRITACDWGWGKFSISYVDFITGERMEVPIDFLFDTPDFTYWMPINSAINLLDFARRNAERIVPDSSYEITSVGFWGYVDNYDNCILVTQDDPYDGNTCVLHATRKGSATFKLYCFYYNGQNWDDIVLWVSVNVWSPIIIPGWTSSKTQAVVRADDIVKTYGDADPEFTYTATGIREGDKLSIGFEREPGEDAGEYAVRPVLINDPESDNNKYTIRLLSGTLTIDSKDVTVTPRSKKKVIGTADPALTAKVNGLVGSDKISYKVRRASGESAGTYNIKASGAEYQGGKNGKNYHVKYKNPGTFTIGYPKSLPATCRAQVAGMGWLDPVSDGDVVGLVGQSRRLEAITISVPRKGMEAITGGIKYRSHVQSYGWQNWTCDGMVSGTTGKSKRIEALQVVIVKKGSPAPANDYNGIVSKTADAHIRG